MRRRVLLLLKPFDVYPPRLRPSTSTSTSTSHRGSNINPKIVKYLDDRCRVHKEAILFCQDVLQRKLIDWKTIMRNDLSQPIKNTDLVVTVGGDGTLLRASHYMDDTISIVGVNSDPTQPQEVEESIDEYDATRSTGYLCAANPANFENVIDEILDGCKAPTELSRVTVTVNDTPLSELALNDILVAHPCPASVSRLSFRVLTDGHSSSLVNCRSSGLRVCTAAGSTAAMQSAGGTPMPIRSKDLQYMVREPISPTKENLQMLHGYIKSGQKMQASWYNKQGIIYIDGCHVFHRIKHGDVLGVSSEAPVLKVYLPKVLSG